MKKASISSDNKLGYQDSYEEIVKYKRRTSNKSKISNVRRNRNEDGREMILSRGTRWFLFFVFFILQMLMNIDHGTFPAATQEIRTDLNIDDNELGIFGSLVFLGNIIGISF